MYQLEQTKYFYLLFTVLVLALLWLWLIFWKKRKQKRFANPNLLKKLSPNSSFFKLGLKIFVLGLSFALLSMALVNPKIGTKMEEVKRSGVDVVFALDVSKSMLAEDIAPNRIEKAKQLVNQIINSLAGDRIGIIGYAGSAFPQLPITTDVGASKLFLSNMNTNMVSSQGTAIKQAIELAETYYNDEDQANKVLFIISDGEDHQGDAEQAAQDAARKGIRIYTIGVGTLKGGPIPIKRNGILQFYKRNQDGEQVITRLNEQTLINTAQAGNGQYINGSNTKEVVEKIKDILNAMDKKEFETKQFTDFKDQFQWFLFGALLLLIVDVFLLERKTQWLKKLNLFNEEV